jgi:large subunit ribosomal protein L4
MQVDILNIKGEKTGRTVDLPADIFGIEPNEHSVYLAVKQYLAAQRQGNHKSKERSEQSGSTRKLHKQKGTGGSRKGDINSPMFRGGATVFGPKPHDYVIKLNKKVRHLARKSALSAKIQANKLQVIEDFTFDAPRTKSYIEILSNLGVYGQKSLLVTDGMDDNLFRSARNVQKAHVARAQDLNTYQVMNAGTVILTESSLKGIEATFA